MTVHRNCLALALALSFGVTPAWADPAWETTSNPDAYAVTAAPAPGPALPGAIFPESAVKRPVVSPFATGCSHTMGLLGFYFRPEIESVLVANGITVVDMDAVGISAATLAGIDALYVLRSGSGTASANAATLDTWIRGGGVMMTEFSATQIFYGGGPLGYLSGALVDGFYVPSGTVCGGNAMVVNLPGNALATDLPPAWDCSGDPFGVFQTFAGIDPQLCVIVSIFLVDHDGDGIDDPAVAMANIDAGVIVPIYSDFGDFQALMSPRDCSGGISCNRTDEDESILVNVACRALGCGPSNVAPTCDAGPDVSSDCREAVIDLAAAEDEDEDELTWVWSSSNPDVTVVPDSGVLAAGPGSRPIPPAMAILADGVPACGVTAELTLTVTDTSGEESACVTNATFSDVDPPTLAVDESSSACIWPPNHSYVCFSIADFSYAVSDSCGEVTVTLVGCTSDQPDEAPDDLTDFNGDGNFTEDCVISPAGDQVCVRAERAGSGAVAQGGRSYSLIVVATDECANASEELLVPLAHVAHDQSPGDGDGCLDPTKVGIKKGAPFPWE